MTALKPPPRGSYDYLLRPRLEPEARGPIPPPREPPRPPRVTVNIEIVQCAPKPRKRSYALWWIALALFALGAVL
jgi:hypothetical protein